jgi:hypothetical protein
MCCTLLVDVWMSAKYPRTYCVRNSDISLRDSVFHQYIKDPEVNITKT